MADPAPYPDTSDDTGTPPWVKVSGIIIVTVLVRLVAVQLFTGCGLRHTP